MKAAKEAFYRNKGMDWAKASGKHRATYLRAFAKRVSTENFYLWGLGDCNLKLTWFQERYPFTQWSFHLELVPYDIPLVVLHTKSFFFFTYGACLEVVFDCE